VQYLRSFVAQLPYDIQQTLLEYTISAEIISSQYPEMQTHLQSKSHIRHMILEIYKNYYKIFESAKGARDRFDKLAIAWFSSDIAKKPARCLYTYNTRKINELPLWARWKSCKKADKSQAKVQQLAIESPFGYIGTINPLSNDFCIKNMQPPSRLDKRKILAGKRCINWTKIELTKLMALVFKVPAGHDSHFDMKKARGVLMHNAEMRDVCSKLDEDQITRVAYWYSQTRESICSKLRQWLQENRLIQEDYNCGVQEKRK